MTPARTAPPGMIWRVKTEQFERIGALDIFRLIRQFRADLFGGAIKLTDALLEYSSEVGGRWRARVTLATLGDHMGRAWASSAAGYCRRQVRRLLRELTHLGMIRVIPSKVGDTDGYTYEWLTANLVARDVAMREAKAAIDEADRASVPEQCRPQPMKGAAWLPRLPASEDRELAAEVVIAALTAIYGKAPSDADLIAHARRVLVIWRRLEHPAPDELAAELARIVEVGEAGCRHAGIAYLLGRNPDTGVEWGKVYIRHPEFVLKPSRFAAAKLGASLHAAGGACGCPAHRTEGIAELGAAMARRDAVEAAEHAARARDDAWEAAMVEAGRAWYSRLPEVLRRAVEGARTEPETCKWIGVEGVTSAEGLDELLGRGDIVDNLMIWCRLPLPIARAVVEGLDTGPPGADR